jgi:hypothetical protein
MIEYLEYISDNNRSQCIDLYNFIHINCKDAPGSSNNHQHWNGGYIDHIKEVFKYCIDLYSLLSERDLNFTLSDAMLVLFLHDIEKPIKYSKLNGTLGDDDILVKEELIRKFGFNLTIDHLIALKYIHGEGEDYRKDKRVMNPLGAFCHCCDVISSRIFFNYPI